MKPKIHSILSNFLHTNEKINTYPHISPPSFLLSEEMDFYFRKVLKYSDIKYQFNRRNRTLTINDRDSPFRLFMEFCDYGVTVRPIPWGDCTFFFQSSYPSRLIKKMIEKRIITASESRKIRIPVEVVAIEEKAPY